jgi:tetratricopeptide (TPR) repeat protein
MKQLISVVIVILLMLSIMSYADKAEDLYMEGVIENGLKNYHSAITLFDKAIEINPNASHYYVSRGTAKYGLGQFDEALNDCNKAIQLDPDYIAAHLQRAIIKNKLGKHFEAIEDCNKALGFNQDVLTLYEADIYVIRAKAKAGLGQYQDAIKDHDTAISKEPGNSNLYLYRGETQAKSGQYESAIDDYDNAIKIQLERLVKDIEMASISVVNGVPPLSTWWFPEDVDKLTKAYCYRARTNVEFEKPWLALGDLTSAIEVNMDCVEAYYQRGNIKQDLGFNHSAMLDFQQMLRCATKTDDKPVAKRARDLINEIRKKLPQ